MGRPGYEAKLEIQFTVHFKASQKNKKKTSSHRVTQCNFLIKCNQRSDNCGANKFCCNSYNPRIAVHDYH